MTSPDDPRDLRADATPDNPAEPAEASSGEQRLEERRRFLIGLGRWSKVVVLGAIGGGALLGGDPARAGRAWVNRRGAVGGGAWANRNTGGSWANRNSGGAGWANRNGGGAWANRRGGFGGSWANRR